MSLKDTIKIALNKAEIGPGLGAPEDEATCLKTLGLKLSLDNIDFHYLLFVVCDFF